MKRCAFALVPISSFLFTGMLAGARSEPPRESRQLEQEKGPQSPKDETRPNSLGLSREDRKEYEKRLTQELERLLAKLRAATTAEEKQRLEQAIVDLVRGELRGVWLAIDFTLLDVDAEKLSLRVAIARPTLMVDRLLLVKDAQVWLDDQPSRLADLSAGMAVALQVAVDGEQRLVGVRAYKGRRALPTAAEIDRLIKQLGSDKFDEREAASRALAALGMAARPALTQATKGGDAEVRSRAERLLEVLSNNENTWYFSASHEAAPDLTHKCTVLEADGKLYCVNERGERSQATVSIDRDRLELNALDWKLKARLEIDKEEARIKWANGSKWTHKRP
jgi:hypothetical protein